MDRKTVLLLHGFASSAQSTKAQYLARRFATLPHVAFHPVEFNPTPKDFECMTTTGLINRLRQYVLDHEIGQASIIGSSYGGLIAVQYAHCFGGIDRMLLLAPDLRWLSGGLSAQQLEKWAEAGSLPVLHFAFEEEVPVRYDLQIDGLRYLEPVPPLAQIVIIHGKDDITVPIDHSRRYAADFPDKVELREVEADHDLNGHLDLIWDYVESFLLGNE